MIDGSTEPPVPAASPAPPAGWYPEPGKEGVLRYWNGSAWEDWRQPAVAPPPSAIQRVERAPGNGLAVASLVLGIFSAFFALTLFAAPSAQVFMSGLPSILGIIFGGFGISAARSGRPRRMAATWGLCLSLVAFILIIVAIIVRTPNGGFIGST